MKKRTAASLTFFAAILAVSIVMVSCNKKFDAPPYYIAPNVTATNTLMGLKAVYGSLSSGTAALLPDSVIITGTVTADDSSGNFFKTIVIQDSTGGISIQLAGTNLYTTYNQGRQVWIKCKGLYIGNYNNSLTIGAGPGVSATTGKPLMNGIPSTQIPLYVIAGDMLNNITPKLVTASQLSTNLLDPLQNVLIQLDNYQFADADLGRTFADPTLISTTAGTFYPQTCTGTNRSLELYNSNYAYFSNVPVPTGKGSLIGIYTVYGTYEELEIRDTSDVKFYGLRCDGSTGSGNTGGATGPRISVAALRALYTGNDIKITGPYSIGGVVIGTSTAGSLSNGNIVIQDGNAGISLYFGGTLNYKLGDSVVVDVTGDSLLNYRGSLEVKFLGSGNATVATASGQVITPKVMTIDALTTALNTPLGSATNIENTLVKIQSVTASPSGVAYTATKTLTDPASKTISFFTRDVSYGSTIAPTTCLDVVGIVTPFSGAPEIKIRSTADVTTGSGCTGGGGGGPITGTGITLGATSPLILNFDGIGSGLPAGVSVRNSANATTLGTDVSSAFTSTPISWTKTSLGFKNFASATGLSATTDSTTQANASNRALGLRETSSAGYDPGSAFVFQIDNTTGKTGVKLDFLLQSLDATGAPRTVTWKVDYATGDNPTTFTPATPTGTLTTGNNVFSNNPVSVNFGSALDNQSGKVWIRIVTLSASTGSGNRASTAIDDFKVSWN